MAHKKGQGSTRNGRDSISKRRGIKACQGEFVRAGHILVRQCGTKWHPGNHTKLGNDYTIFALKDGVVSFRKSNKTWVSVLPVSD